MAYTVTLWWVTKYQACEYNVSSFVRVYAVLALYLLVCSFALTIKAFIVSAIDVYVSVNTH